MMTVFDKPQPASMSSARLQQIADQAGRLAGVGSGRIAGVRLDAFAEDVFDLLAYVARLELELARAHHRAAQS
jgi:hypothetical protein